MSAHTVCDCELCRKREAGKSCGCLRAGIMIEADRGEIEDDSDAAACVEELIKILGAVYERGPVGMSVADALDVVALACGVK